MKEILSSYEGQTVLAIGAHPDDVEIGAGGTVARLTRAGARVVMVAAVVPSELETRLQEFEIAASVLGARALTLNTEECMRVEDLRTYDLVGQLDGLVREFQPAAILTHSTEETHWDHVLLSRAVNSSLRLRPMDVFFFGPTTCRNQPAEWRPRMWVDISEVIEDKLRAIAAHRSQFGDRGLCTEIFREQARSTGSQVGCEYAEGLQVVRMVT